MWNGKRKAVTFSIDDGCDSDKRIIEIFDKYGVKGTFNLNSGLLDTEVVIKNERGEVKERRFKVKACEVFDIYKNHEIAVHTCNHYNLTTLSEEKIIEEVEEDRKKLEALIGYKIVGMAYPCGGVNNDERVAGIIEKNTPIRYARTITSTYSFDLQKNLLRFNPTIHWKEDAPLFSIVEKFLKSNLDKPQLLYIWGHAFELDQGTQISYEDLERVCKLLSEDSDIFFGTNREIFGLKYDD